MIFHCKCIPLPEPSWHRDAGDLRAPRRGLQFILHAEKHLTYSASQQLLKWMNACGELQRRSPALQRSTGGINFQIALSTSLRPRASSRFSRVTPWLSNPSIFFFFLSWSTAWKQAKLISQVTFTHFQTNTCSRRSECERGWNSQYMLWRGFYLI